MPKVSIIMGVYNCADTLRESIDSVLNQTFDDWEFIICDDCSSDDTYQISLKYQKQYPGKFIILKNDVNSKLSFSLNHCLENAGGEYIARMDGDDICFPERLQKQVDFLDKNKEYSVVGTWCTRFDEESGDYGETTYPEYPDKYTLLKQSPYAHVSILMRKKVFDALNGYTVSPITVRGQDADLWFRFYAAGYKGANLCEDLVHVRENKNAVARRTMKVRINNARLRFKGYRLLKYPVKYYYKIFVPVFKGLVPKSIILAYHKNEK